MYFSLLIANDSAYNFPQTNLITFEPGARLSWHLHGGDSEYLSMEEYATLESEEFTGRVKQRTAG